MEKVEAAADDDLQKADWARQSKFMARKGEKYLDDLHKAQAELRAEMAGRAWKLTKGKTDFRLKDKKPRLLSHRNIQN